MSLGILTNSASLVAQNNLNNTTSQLDQAIAQLSSGLKINSPADNPAGYAISQQMQSQINGFNQAVNNANDGISFAQVANGALSTITQSIQSIRTLAVQASNSTNSAQDRQALNQEVQQAIQQVNATANTTQFNGQNILNGSLGSLVFQTGADAGQNIQVSGLDVRGQSLGATYETGGSINVTGSASGGGSFTLNGVQVTVGASSSSSSTVNNIIGAINNVSSESGVYAQQASTTSATVNISVSGSSSSGTITLDGVSIGIASGASSGAIISAINAFSGQTGITAAASGSTAGNITLTDNTGAAIQVSGSSNVTVASGGTIDAGIELYTTPGGSITVGGSFSGTIGLSSATAKTVTLNEASVSTYSGAQSAIKIADFALSQLSQLGGQLGAIQNRFTQTISNLQTNVTNTTSAQGRIQDANFAQATAQLTQAQVLQQAGASMVAQANSIPQIALTLLK